MSSLEQQEMMLALCITGFCFAEAGKNTPLFVILQKSKFAVRPRVIEFALEKKEEGPYWDRLLADKTKQHWLKIDFNKWKDEDESDEEGEGGQGNLEEVSLDKTLIRGR